MADFSIRQNDRLPILTATLLDSSSVAVNLTSATSVVFHLKSLSGTPLVNAAAAIDNAGGGVVSYAWGASDTATPGAYRGEFEVTWTGGKKQSFPNPLYLTIEITEELA